MPPGATTCNEYQIVLESGVKADDLNVWIADIVTNYAEKGSTIVDHQTRMMSEVAQTGTTVWHD
jgi:hypothetical protein